MLREKRISRLQDDEHPLDERMRRKASKGVPKQRPAVRLQVLLGRGAAEAGARASCRDEREVAGHILGS